MVQRESTGDLPRQGTLAILMENRHEDHIGDQEQDTVLPKQTVTVRLRH